MSIAHVVTGGFGNGTFLGQIRQVVVGGFFDSILAPVQVAAFTTIGAAPNSGTHDFPSGQYFLGETSFSISPALEAGWSFNTSTGLLTIDTDAQGLFGPYTITGINAAGSTPGEPFYVNIRPSAAIGTHGLNIHLGIGL